MRSELGPRVQLRRRLTRCGATGIGLLTLETDRPFPVCLFGTARADRLSAHGPYFGFPLRYARRLARFCSFATLHRVYYLPALTLNTLRPGAPPELVSY